MKYILMIIVFLLLILFIIGLVVTTIEKYQSAENKKVIEFQKNQLNNSASKSIVIYFSRSSTTALVAQRIANNKNAKVIELESKKYELGFTGWIKSLVDAREDETNIFPRTVDLSSYDKVYLGSPIWLYSPAPPIWTFLKNNNFKGKKVILFNTYNSHFEKKYIDEFKKIALENEAISFKHLPFLRGRMSNQISNDELLNMVDESLK